MLGEACASYHKYGPSYNLETTACADRLRGRTDLRRYGWNVYCAHYLGSFPYTSTDICGTCLRVTNLANNKSTILRIVDRCSNGRTHAVKGGPGKHTAVAAEHAPPPTLAASLSSLSMHACAYSAPLPAPHPSPSPAPLAGIDADEADLAAIAGPSNILGMTDMVAAGGMRVRLEQVAC